MAFEKFLKKNLDLKILSLIVSAFLWLFVHLTQAAEGIGAREANLRIPIVVENLSPKFHVVDSDRFVSITVKGVRHGIEGTKSIEGIKPSDFKASVDLDGKGAGAFRNLPVHVASPVGVVVTDIAPPKAEVVVDEEGDKTVPVTWEFSGNKNSGKLSINPREVVIKGPKSQVDRVVAAKIQIPDEEESGGIQEDYSPTPVDILSRPVPGLSIIPERIHLITKYSELAKPVPVRPDIIGKLPLGMELKSVSVSPYVVLAESINPAKPVDHVDTSPIDVTDKQGTLFQTVKLEVPAGAKIHGKSEATVIMVIGKRG